jgi:hypothetical protein
VDNVDDKEDMTAIDDGGPTKEFLSNIWNQLHTFCIECVSISDVIKIPLFIDGGPIDDMLLTYYTNKSENLNQDYINKIQLYYRVLGRIMFYCISSSRRFYGNNNNGNHESNEIVDLFIAPHVMPRLYRYYFLQGIEPNDKRYPISELKDDIIEMKSLNPNKPEDQIMNDYLDGLGVDCNAYSTNEECFRKTAQEEFINRRKIALGALYDGMTLGEMVNLQCLFSSIPMNYINVILFAMANATAKDVIAVLQPQYDESNNDDIIVLQKLILAIDTDEEKTQIGYLPTLLISKERSDPDFIRKFIRFCTGNDFIPNRGTNADFHITVEFNHNELKNDNSWPVSHTCVNVLKLPGTAYHGNYETFENKLLNSINNNLGFDMN